MRADTGLVEKATGVLIFILFLLLLYVLLTIYFGGAFFWSAEKCVSCAIINPTVFSLPGR